MKKSEKQIVIAELTETFKNNQAIYLADTTGLSANDTNRFRRMLYQNGVQMRMAKNTLVKRAMEESGLDFSELFGSLKGTTCIMTGATQKSPAQSIKKFRDKKGTLPILKGAWIEQSVFIGDNQLDTLVNLKTKADLVGEIIGLLQSPARNVIGALQANAGQKIAGLVKALGDK